MREIPQKILAFVVRHETSLALTLFSLWTLALAFEGVGTVGNVIRIYHGARWLALAFVSFMFLRDWKPYRSLHARFREERRAGRSLPAEMERARRDELLRLVASVKRGETASKDMGLR